MAAGAQTNAPGSPSREATTKRRHSGRVLPPNRVKTRANRKSTGQARKTVNNYGRIRKTRQCGQPYRLLHIPAIDVKAVLHLDGNLLGDERIRSRVAHGQIARDLIRLRDPQGCADVIAFLR